VVVVTVGDTGAYTVEEVGLSTTLRSKRIGDIAGPVHDGCRARKAHREPH
jgi:hypothetical protein